MRILIFTIIILCQFARLIQQLRIFSEDFIWFINKKHTTWTACKNFPENTTLDQLKKIIGSGKISSIADTKILHHKIEYYEDLIPLEFDVREKWPDCKNITNVVVELRDNCDVCWAALPTSVMDDRICIETNGKDQFTFSFEDAAACCEECQATASKAGRIPKIWEFWVQKGIVSGGDQGCRPFSGTGTCSTSCTNPSYTTSYPQDKRFGGIAYRLPKDMLQIQIEIYVHGPVTAQFMTHEDFFIYQQGVYAHIGGHSVGNHVVKILGWGSESGRAYWLCVNSWGTSWGNLSGFFKILRGSNYLGIESEIRAGRTDGNISSREFLESPSSTFSKSRSELLLSVLCFSCIVLTISN